MKMRCAWLEAALFLVLGSWFLVLCSWFLVLCSLFLVLGSWFLVKDLPRLLGYLQAPSSKLKSPI
ncbi:MAG: hypothetical protein Q8M16_17470 [Pirellulaceae bacterium]|nr:hypothetical protein [Pirellulaceae bacterium]